MIVVKSIKHKADFHTFDVTLYADTKAEVTTANVQAVIPSGGELEAGSVVYTADMEVGVYQSTGSWKWGD